MKKILLTRGETAIIDDEDYELVSTYSWHVEKRKHTFYAISTRATKLPVRMHRLIMGLDFDDPKRIDHINGNGLDNRHANLRVCTQSQNCMNRRKGTRGTSVFKGVVWAKDNKKWRASIFVDHKYKSLGYYFSEIDAACAYDLAAIKYFRDFACLNFPKCPTWAGDIQATMNSI